MQVWAFFLAAFLLPASIPRFAPDGLQPQPRVVSYRFSQILDAAAESPVKGSAVCRVKIAAIHDVDGRLTGGAVDFGAELKFESAVKITGMQLLSGRSAVDSGISASDPVASGTGRGHLSRSVEIAAENRPGMNVLRGISSDPTALALMLTVSGGPDGVLQSKLLPSLGYVPHLAQGEGHSSVIHLTNPSTDSQASVLLKFYDGYGSPVRAVADAEVAFVSIAPSSTTTFAKSGAGGTPAAYAHVYSSAPLSIEVSYASPQQKSSIPAKCVLARSVSFPVSFDPERSLNTRMGIEATGERGTHLAYSLRDSSGADIPGASNSVDFLFGKQMTILVSDLIRVMAGRPFEGTLTLERRWASFPAGRMAVIVLQCEKDKVAPVPITVISP